MEKGAERRNVNVDVGKQQSASRNVCCPPAEEMCKSKWTAGGDALKLIMVQVSL